MKGIRASKAIEVIKAILEEATSAEDAVCYVTGEDSEALKAAVSAMEREEADGCEGCAFTDVEEWEMPCRMCRRANKDYWRAKT